MKISEKEHKRKNADHCKDWSDANEEFRKKFPHEIYGGKDKFSMENIVQKITIFIVFYLYASLDLDFVSFVFDSNWFKFWPFEDEKCCDKVE